MTIEEIKAYAKTMIELAESDGKSNEAELIVNQRVHIITTAMHVCGTPTKPWSADTRSLDPTKA